MVPGQVQRLEMVAVPMVLKETTPSEDEQEEISSSQVQLIVDYLNEGKCALFVGPDLSESAHGFRGLPTSWQLADELATMMGYRGRYYNLPQTAQIFEKNKNRTDLVRFLIDRLRGKEYQPLPVHEMIVRIPFSVIVNGSWDSLLEKAMDQRKIPYYVVNTNDDLRFLPSDGRKILFKPYGSIDKPYFDDEKDLDSLVITEEDQHDIFVKRNRVIARLKDVIEEYALVLIGYAPFQDTVFVRIYHDIHDSQAKYSKPAVVVQSLTRKEDADAWKARDVEAVIEDPASFLCKIAGALAKVQNQEWEEPDLATLSKAPRLTIKELETQAALLNNTMDHIGVAELIEQTNVPLLSDEQLRDIEAMRVSYERLMQSFAPEQGQAYLWLRQGNLEYVRKNFERAEEYYQRALKVQPDMPEVYHNLHFIRLAQRDWDGALQAYQKALELKKKAAEPGKEAVEPKEVSLFLPARYQVEKVLGGGGVGIVYQALDRQTNRRVAVKVLHPAQVQTEKVFKSFEREAHILQSLKHPNIVQILDYQSYLGTYYIVMEFLDGKTLKEELAELSKPLPLDRTFQITEQVCDALTYAHGLNIVHRDIKPSNIFLAGEQAKLIDFGLARQLTGEELTMLEEAGTTAYMAPEQIEGSKVDARTDEYAVATVFYEMITRVNPQGAYASPSEAVDGLNSALDQVIETARERDPNKRYPSVKDFRTELQRVVSLQAASSSAPWWVKWIARIAQAATVAVTRWWWVWLAAGVLLGFVIAPFAPAPLARELSYYSAAGLLITLLLTVVFKFFTFFIARRTHSASVAAYGPLMGLVLGTASSFLFLRSYSYVFVVPEPRLGYAGTIEFVMLTGQSIMQSLILGIVVLLILFAVGLAARRGHRPFYGILFTTFILLTILILIAAFILPYGWFGDLSLPPGPST